MIPSSLPGSPSQARLPFLSDGVAQIAFVVKDLDRTVESYYRLFGIGPWHFYTYGRPLLKRMTRDGKAAEYRMRIALSYFGSQRVELIEHAQGDTVYSEFIRKHGYGVQHLGVLVEDMERALDQARAAGLRVTMEGSGFGRDGDGWYAYLDTEELLGTTLELIQRPSARVSPERIYPSEEGSV